MPDIVSETDVFKPDPISFGGLNESTKKDLLSKFELVATRRIVYDLPILIIYNPNSGKKANLYNLIVARLTTANVPFVFQYSSLSNLPF